MPLDMMDLEKHDHVLDIAPTVVVALTILCADELKSFKPLKIIAQNYLPML